ncbi:MAG: hypothetical protein V4808_12100 [Pseudomonadota bacterium]
MITILLLSAAIAFVSQDAASQTGAAAQDGPIVVQGQQKARDKRVCRRAISTGSIMSKVTCKTAGEWEIERDRQTAQVEQMRQRRLMEEQAHLEKFGN